MSVTYKLPYDTPLRYLPLVYILPHDLLMRCPTLRKLPRRMGAFNDPEWQEVLGSQQFRNEIMDAMAALAFPHFGFGGWKEHYSGYFPAWYLSYALPLWAKGIEQERGWGPQALFNLSPDFGDTLFRPGGRESVHRVGGAPHH